MDGIFQYVKEETFWSILLFVHFVLAVGLLAAVTIQAVMVLMPARQVAGRRLVSLGRTLPLRVPIVAGEALDSWLEALARRHQVTVGDKE